MIDLKFIDNFEENIISIKQKNKIKIVNYNNYLKLYKHFYFKEELYIQNKEVTKKDYIFYDISTISNIFAQMEFKKGTLLYEYIVLKYGEVDFLKKEKFYNSFLEQVSYLKEKINVDLDIDCEENIDKMLFQNIDLKLNFLEVLKSLNVILNDVIENNINKTFIIFYNSQLLTLNFMLDNYYIFDTNQFLNINEYNLLILDDFLEFDCQRLISLVQTQWPIDYKDGEIEYLVDLYFKIGINQKTFVTKNERLYLLAFIIRKTYNLSQEIYCDKLIINNIIKSFVDLI